MARLVLRIAVVAVGIGLLVVTGCGDDNPSGTEDSARPAPVVDLAARTTGAATVLLNWTAVGDDSLAGTAAVYDIRYTTSSTPRWDASTRASGEPSPKEAGQPESFTVTGLAPNITYRFLLKVADEKDNASAESNVAIATTLASDADLAWWPGFAPYPAGQGTDGSVYAFAPFDGELIAGGGFSRAGGVQAGNIAAWNGSSWSALGGGTNGFVVAMTEYGDRLAAGGAFTLAGGSRAMYLAFWDGSHWDALRTELDGTVAALAVYDGDLIIGGGFRRAGEDTVNYIVRFDGNGFSPLGTGMDDWVNALAVHDGKLIAGGYFKHAGGDSAVYVAAWDGTRWQSMGLGTEEPAQALAGVLSLTEYGGALHAGGTFHSLGGAPAVYLARWDGASWNSFDEISGGTFTDPGVRAMTVHEGRLCITGRFQTVGGIVTNHIVAWDGTAFQPLGVGIVGQGYRAGIALVDYEGSLYLGGTFNAVGNRPAAGIARWDD
jgi:hypothetical protein